MKKSVWLLIGIIFLIALMFIIYQVFGSNKSAKEGVLISNFIEELDGIPLDDIYVVSLEEKEWPDSCLGLPREEEICAQVVVPGYEIVFDYEGMTLKYRTNMDGSISRLEI